MKLEEKTKAVKLREKGYSLKEISELLKGFQEQRFFVGFKRLSE
jgi:DNA-binding transcriptional MerR regulator